ncbi:MAG TPA: nucleotidyltransferase family protein [Rhizomicrobium sp.]|nr:nucleotidyltransferase family protein [Rhizomicrobium sp.]
MNRDKAIHILLQHRGELERAGVRHLYLFGSVARNEAHAQSDVDLFFDYDKGQFGLFALMEVKDLASNILGRKADIMTRDSVHPVFRPRIEAEAAQVY